MQTKHPGDERFTANDARHFYDRFGARQDRQGFYEDAALARLIDAGSIYTGHRVFEFGCGTGRIAAQLLAHATDTQFHYHGVDISSTMIELAQERVAAFADRARVDLVHAGEFPMPVATGWADRFFSSYVFDLLGEASIQTMLAEAARILAPDGLFCHAGITPGTGVSALVSAGWLALHRINPAWVGGCRPIVLRDKLQANQWEVIVAERVCRWGITSEVLVARRQPFSRPRS